MGLAAKFLLMAQVIRAVHDGYKNESTIKDALADRHWIKGSEVLSSIGLAKQFGFLSGDKFKVSIEKNGLEFMKYIESLPNPDEVAEENLSARMRLQKIRKENPDAEIRKLVEQILEAGNNFHETLPDLESYETYITITLPYGINIPNELRGQIISNKIAMNKVWADCEDELIIVTPFLDVSVLQMILDQSPYGKETSCTIITSERNLLKEEEFMGRMQPRNLNNLKDQLKLRFKSYKVYFVKDTQTQAHAKIWLSEKSALITSANVLPNSQTNNFELGLYTDSPLIVQTCRQVLERIFPLCKEL